MRKAITVLAAVAALTFVLAGNLAAKESPKTPSKQVILQVDGMTCTGCEAKVERALQEVEGVQKVDADYRTGRVVVRTDGKVSKEKLEKAVEQTGFEVVDKHDAGSEHSKDCHDKQRKDCEKKGGCCKDHGDGSI